MLLLNGGMEISLLLFDFLICISQQKIDLPSYRRRQRRICQNEGTNVANKQTNGKEFYIQLMPFLLFYNAYPFFIKDLQCNAFAIQTIRHSNKFVIYTHFFYSIASIQK